MLVSSEISLEKWLYKKMWDIHVIRSNSRKKDIFFPKWVYVIVIKSYSSYS